MKKAQNQSGPDFPKTFMVYKQGTCCCLMNGVNSSLRVKFTNYLHHLMTSRITNVLPDQLVQASIAGTLWTHSQATTLMKAHLNLDILQQILATNLYTSIQNTCTS